MSCCGDAVMLLYRQSEVAKASHQVSLLKLEDGDNYIPLCNHQKI